MRTPLYNEHLRLGARMTEFAGWEMPVYYAGIVQEVRAVRSAAGIFDLSHMGELVVSGLHAPALIQYVTTNDITLLEVGQAQYTLMCDEDGGILDDLVIYHMWDNLYVLVVNAANTSSDFEWLQEHSWPESKCEDHSSRIALAAVQGPASQAIMQPLVQFELAELSRFTVRSAKVGSLDCWIARTGYTGEDGFEVYCQAVDAVSLWQLLLEAGKGHGAEPAGLGARDILRLEAGYPLYGHELSQEVTPVEAGLLRAVRLGKGDFIGRHAIQEAAERGPRQQLIGLKAIERCVPRQGYDVMADGERIGMVTSGTFSPTLEKGIALAYVSPQYAEESITLDVQIRRKSCHCQMVKLPFYRATTPAKTAMRGVTSAT